MRTTEIFLVTKSESSYELQIETPALLYEVASHLLKKYKEQPLWLFKGELGSGKTSLISALCRSLGIRGAICSPTFTLVHSYRTPEGLPVLHADLYRLTQSDELYELGISEYFYGPGYCFVEWADKFPTYWPCPQLWLQLVSTSYTQRRLILGHRFTPLLGTT